MPRCQLPAGSEDQGGVVHQAVLAELGDAARHQEEIVSVRRLGQLGCPRPVPRFGVAPGVVSHGLGVVATGPQLGQDQQFDAATRGIGHHAQGH